MDPWFAKLGRLGLAYRGVVSVKGFRRLWWRLWWRTGPHPLRMPVDPHAPDLTVDPDIGKRPLHWAATSIMYAGGGQPACGADPLYNLTTMEPEGVRGCPICKSLARGAELQRRFNVR